MFVALLLAIGFIGTPAAALRPPAPSAATGFDLYRNKIVFSAIVQGHKATAVLDSGADFSAVDTAFAVAAGLKPGAETSIAAITGRISTRVVPAVRLDVPGQVQTVMPMLAADLSQASKLMGRKVDFILGGDILRKMALELRFGDRRFRLLASGTPPPPGFSRITVVRAHYAGLMPFDVNGTKLLGQVDLGAGNDLRISPQAWERVKPAGVVLSDSSSGSINGLRRIEHKAGCLCSRSARSRNGRSTSGSHRCPRIWRAKPMRSSAWAS